MTKELKCLNRQLLSFETAFWLQLSQDKSCHCKTMRVFSTFINFTSIYDAKIKTTMWNFECFRRHNVIYSNNNVWKEL